MTSWRDDAIVNLPRKIPPKDSWWAHPRAQQSREVFIEMAHAEADRIVGNTRFGGKKPTHDKFSQSK